MSTTSKVDAATGANSAAGRVATGSRASAFDRVDAVPGGLAVGFSGHWRPSYDDAPRSFYATAQDADDDEEAPQFTPLVARLAAAFPASLSMIDGQFSPILFLTDLVRGVGIYEINMRLFAGTFAIQGSVINRYS